MYCEYGQSTDLKAPECLLRGGFETLGVVGRSGGCWWAV